MIEYIEVRDSTRDVIGIIDTAQSIIWHSVWFGVGDFEIYAKATNEHLDLLQIGNYVSHPGSDEAGIIESLKITTSIDAGAMITATGRFAKSILDRRIICNLSGTTKITNKATVLSGRVETAVRSLVTNNAISCPFDSGRNIPILELGADANIPLIIVDEHGNATKKQVSYQNLLSYTDELLEEYGLSSKVVLNDDTKKLQYIVLQGEDRSINNSSGNEPVIFSRDYDNLSDSVYDYETQSEKNTSLIGGSGQDVKRFYSMVKSSDTGLNRREMFVDANNLAKTYIDSSEVEQEYSDAEYAEMLRAQGKQKLAPLTKTESFSGTILVTSGNYILNQDFYLGDIVMVQENSINKYIDVRIREVTEVQDENGYTVEAVYN